MNRQYRETPVQNTVLIYQNELIPSLSFNIKTNESAIQGNSGAKHRADLSEWTDSQREFQHKDKWIGNNRKTPVQNTALIYQNELIPSLSFNIKTNESAIQGNSDVKHRADLSEWTDSQLEFICGHE